MKRPFYRRHVVAPALAALLVLFFVTAPLLDFIANRRTGAPVPQVTSRGRELHRQLWVADLHADSLMWNRDPLEPQERGLVDVPRLIRGNVALQAFTIVSKVPWGMNISRNTGSTDMLTLLVVAQRWPLRTWLSLTERALYQAERLHAAARASGGKLTVIHTRSELEAYTARRAASPDITAGFLGIEGAHALEGKLDNLRRLFDAGFRMISPSHFFDTEVGGSAHGEDKGGLTLFGREVIQEMERLGMLVDLAHASRQTIEDVLAIAQKPVVFSHTGLVGACNNQRNLSDALARRAAKAGGLIGIAFFDTATCGEDLAAVARSIRYAIELVGVQHVALGSDFDGFVRTPIDAAGLPALTEALLAAGLGEAEIAAVMGENVRRVLAAALPP